MIKLNVHFGLCAAFFALSAHADDYTLPVDITVGVKAWYASWQSYTAEQVLATNGTNVGVVNRYQLLDDGGHFDYIPNLGVKFGENRSWLFSVSQLNAQRDFYSDGLFIVPGSPMPLLANRQDHFHRKETDVNLGYFFVPSLLVSAGYKFYDETRDISVPAVNIEDKRLSHSRGNGPLIGVSFSFSILDGISGYGQFAAARARGNLDTDIQSSKLTSDYLVAEIGVSRFIPVAGALKGVALSGGYRIQNVRTKAPQLGALTTVGETRVTDSRDGLTIGINGLF